MGAKPTELTLNGLKIEVFKTKVKIFDSHGDVSDLEAEKVIKAIERTRLKGILEEES